MPSNTLSIEEQVIENYLVNDQHPNWLNYQNSQYSGMSNRSGSECCDQQFDYEFLAEELVSYARVNERFFTSSSLSVPKLKSKLNAIKEKNNNSYVRIKAFNFQLTTEVLCCYIEQLKLTNEDKQDYQRICKLKLHVQVPETQNYNIVRPGSRAKRAGTVQRNQKEQREYKLDALRDYQETKDFLLREFDKRKNILQRYNRNYREEAINNSQITKLQLENQNLLMRSNYAEEEKRRSSSHIVEIKHTYELQIQQLRERQRDLLCRLEEKDIEMRQMMNQFQNQETERLRESKGLRQRVDSLLQSNEDLRESLRNSSAKREKIQEELKALYDEAKNRQIEKSKAQMEAHELAEQNAELKEQLRTKNNSYVLMEKEVKLRIEELLEKVRVAQQQVKNKCQKIVGLNAQIQIKNKEEERTKSELNKIEKTNIQLRKDLTKKEQEKALAEIDVKKKTYESEQFSNQNIRYKEELSLKCNEINQLKEELHLKIDEMKEKEIEAKHLSEQNKRLSGTIGQKMDFISRMTSHFLEQNSKQL